MALDPTFWGFLVFGILAGLCPCNSMLCLALMGYVTGENKEERNVRDALLLTLPFGLGTLLVIVPLGGIVAFLGRSVVLFDERIAYALGSLVLPLVIISSIGGTAGKAIRAELNEKGGMIDRVLGTILILASIYFFYLSLK